MNVFVQVKTADTSTKTGLCEEEVETLCTHIRHSCPSLQLQGLMVVPDPRTALESFRTVQALAKKLELSGLSMGMSADLADAVACGSTLVRVGTAIFGKRGEID